jgi:hypothetical protein
LKKNRSIPHLFPFLILTLFFQAAPGYAFLDAILSVRMEGGLVFADARLDWSEPERIIPGLNDGYKSEIFFEFRLYERVNGPFPFIGDRLVAEKRLVCEGYRDFFSRQFFLETQGAGFREFPSIREFLAAFFVIRNVAIASQNGKNGSGHYVLARISLVPVKFEPPLHIIALFSSMNLTTDWVQSDIIAGDGK